MGEEVCEKWQSPFRWDRVPKRAQDPCRLIPDRRRTEEILLELDLDWDDISAAKDNGAIL